MPGYGFGYSPLVRKFSSSVAPSPYGTLTTAWIAATGETDLTILGALNTLESDLTTYGLTAKMKALYPMVGGTAAKHKYNFMDARDLDAAYRLVFNGGWTHSSTGALPNGTNAYADTKLNASTVLASFNSNHISFYSRTQNLVDSANMGGGSGSAYLTIERSTQWNGSTFINFAVNPTTGLFTNTRTANNIQKFYGNGSQLGSTNTTTSTSSANAFLYLGARNIGGGNQYSARECALASIGDGLTDTEAANFYTAVQAFQTSLGRQVGTPIPFALPLDTYSGAAVAYSAARRLATAYTGSLIRVRRSSDNAEQDIGYDANNLLDQAALTAFVGANNGLVVTIYDQSGNAKNATQATAVNQPRIVNAGTIDLVNGVPAILGDGTNDTLLNSTLSLTNPTSIFTVVDKVGTSGNFGLWSVGGFGGAFNVLSGGYDFYQNGPSFSPSYSNNNQSLLVAKSATTGTDWELYGNNTTVTNGGQNIGNSIGTTVSLFDRNGTQGRANMYMQEFIVWNSNQMTNRAGIQTNINTFYTIY